MTEHLSSALSYTKHSTEQIVLVFDWPEVLDMEAFVAVVLLR